LRPQRGPTRLYAALSDYAALLIHSRTCVRYAGPVRTWHDLDLGRPIAAPLERCAELLGVDLAIVCELAAKVEPYIRADGSRIWSLMQLERQLRPEAYGQRRGATSTVDERSSSTYSWGIGPARMAGTSGNRSRPRHRASFLKVPGCSGLLREQ
jgi:hypothetical protein